MSRIQITDVELIARKAISYTDADQVHDEDVHPFVRRNIQDLPSRVKYLFDNAAYEEASFKAYTYLEKFVSEQSGIEDFGRSLMMAAFKESDPKIQIADTTTKTGVNQQEGMKYLAAGGVMYIRNPRGHEISLGDSPDDCLNFLSMISTLLREIKKGIKATAMAKSLQSNG